MSFEEYWDTILFGRDNLNKYVTEQIYTHAQADMKKENERQKDLLETCYGILFKSYGMAPEFKSILKEEIEK